MKREIKSHPYLKANIISRLFYCWLNEILGKGCDKILELGDVYEALSQDTSNNLCKKLKKNWDKEIFLSYVGVTPSLTKALLKTHGSYVLAWSIVFIIEEILKLICPFLIGGLIRHFVQESQVSFVTYMYALGICMCAIFPTIVHHPYFLAVFKTGMRLRIACCALLYRKLLRLNSFSLDNTATGQIINLMSNDVVRFDMAVGLIPFLFAGPIEVVVVSVVLWFYIGWSGICGMLVLLLIIPFMGVLARMFKKFRAWITVLTDERLSLMTEFLNGVQLIKMSCWESYIELIVSNSRMAEIRKLYSAGYCKALAYSVSFYSGKLITFATFLTYVLLGNNMSAEVVFVTISLFNHVRLTMTLGFPMAIQFCAETSITVKRIQDFLLLDERQIKTSKDPVVSSSLKVTSLSISWNPDKVPVLRNLSFDAKDPDLLMVIGAVGSGKTTLLLTILKELSFLGGELNVSGSVAYVPQSPWIFNDSVRNNILLGSNYCHENYKNVLRYAALEKDLGQLPYGDETIVGERGMSLSGGQKARIGLARAMYRNAGIYLLDAPLSSVDANVGHFLFHKCINGFLAEKLRVLVTHNLQFLSHATKILLIDKNEKHFFGSYQDLVAMEIDFVRLLNESNIVGDSGDDSDFTQQALISQSNPRKGSLEDPRKRLLPSDEVKRPSSASSASFYDGSFPDIPESLNKAENPPGEEMSGSSVSLSTYLTYFRSGGGIVACIACLLLNVMAQANFIIVDCWLAYWCQSVESFMKSHKSLSDVNCSSNSSCHDNSTHLPSTETIQLDAPIFPHTNFYLGIFSGLSMLVVLLGVIRAIQFFRMAISSSNNLHTNMLYAILRSPMTFFVDVPSGQILNRFSKDLGQIDEYLPLHMFDLIQGSFLVLGVFIVISITNPWVILAITPMLILFVILRGHFLKTFRNVKRLEAITKSPVFSHVNSTFSGLHTIRCHGAEDYFMQRFNILQDDNTSTFSLLLYLGRWFAVRLEWLCTVLICVVTFASVAAHQFASGPAVGLSLTYVITLMWLFQWVVRQSTEVEGMMTSAERILEYSRLPIENFMSSNKPIDWPSKGKIEFKDVTLKYKNETSKALNQVNFIINPGEKIGIVGRTGAGKSSLINVLFRLFEFEGEVAIDDINNHSINLHHLRKNLAVIPQDPTLFAGLLRNSLDPLSKHPDEKLWHVLKKVEMDDILREIEEGLYFVVQEGGSNLSVGQRQLLCMARALLENNKILIIDEATANVDRLTDKLIQAKLREEFSGCTVLSIAHRLHTIIDYDRIMVLESGEVKEFDTPYNLLQDKNSEFFKLAKQSGKAEFNGLLESAKVARLKMRE